jgi:hypothetical protein
MIRMLLIGYCFGIRSERRLCYSACNICKLIDRLNFVVVVVSGDSLEEVLLEPPKGRGRGSDKYRLSQP